MSYEAASYEAALKAAGAAVVAYASFGSYQGDWLALCYYNGEFRWVHGSYGSCSACDSFEGEFGEIWREEDNPAEYQRRLVEFGKTYLEDDPVDEAQLDRWREQAEWDSETQDMLKFIEKFPLDEAGKNALTLQVLRGE